MGISVRLVRFLAGTVLSYALKALTVMRLSSREKNEVQVLGGAFKSCHDFPATVKSFSVPPDTPDRTKTRGSSHPIVADHNQVFDRLGFQASARGSAGRGDLPLQFGSDSCNIGPQCLD